MVTELSVLSGIPPKLKLLHHLWNKNIETWETWESLFNQNVQKVHIQTMLMNVCFISLFLGDLDKSATFIWIHFTMFFYEIDF